MTETVAEKSAQERKTTLDKIIKTCQLFDFPTAVFDSNFKCVYSKDELIKLKSKASLYAKNNYIPESRDFFTTIFMIKGVQYCAKILKTDGYYICGLFNSRELGAMARNTDFFSKILPSIDVVNCNVAHLCELANEINNNDFLVAKMKRSLLKAQRVTQSIFEYAYVYLKEPDYVKIDCYDMINSLVKRCNTLLSKIGRHIDFEGDDKTPLYIGADSRHAMSAFISALQNSLLYSKRDHIPLVTLSKYVEGNETYAVLKIVNEISYYNLRPNEVHERNFAGNKIGCGIPIIERFVEECNGQFEFKEENEKAYTLIKLPTIKVYKQEMFVFESGEYVPYETGIPDFLELQISEVIDLFGDDNDFV